MLKIKDNVDLKELEKFGFSYWGIVWSCRGITSDELSYYSFDFDLTDYLTETESISLLKINPLTREITEFIDDRFMNYTQINNIRIVKLFDLIQAGLVEKVKEDVL